MAQIATFVICTKKARCTDDSFVLVSNEDNHFLIRRVVICVFCGLISVSEVWIDFLQ